MIATNAQKILDLRLQGFKPDEMILVSLVGRISEPNHTVLAKPGAKHDWRWVRDLDVCVYINGEIEWRETTLAIARAKPRFLGLWDVPGKRGATVYLKPSHSANEDKPPHLWEWILDFSSWVECDNEAYRQ